MKFKIIGDALLSFEKFAGSQDILGDLAGSVYHTWVDRISRFLKTGCRVLVLYGSYAIGKSYLMKILLLWNLYVITKIHDIRSLFGKSPSDTIVLQLFSPSVGDVGESDLEELVFMLNQSPYFSRVCPVIRKNKKSITLKGRIRITIGKDRGAARSKQLFFAGLDEGNFLSENGMISFRRASAIYKEVTTRIKGRWSLPPSFGIPYLGMVVVASSADSSDAFVEKVIKEGIKSGEVHVERLAKYDVSPEFFGSERFEVFEGESEVPPHIIGLPREGSLNRDAYRNSNIENIILNLYGCSYEDFFKTRSLKIHRPPMDLISFYEKDINDALQTMSGVPAKNDSRLFKTMDYVNRSVVSKNILEDPCLFDDIPLLMGDSTELEDCIDLSILRKNYTGGQVFFHCDQSKSSDTTGIAYVEKSEFQPFKLLLLIRVIPSKTNNVDLMKIAQIPIFLRDVLGWDICFGTYDGFQSLAPVQTLERLLGVGYNPNGQKFKRIGYNSVESSDHYLTMNSLFRRGKIQTYFHEYLFKELTYLLLDRVARKVDHPDVFDSGEKGSKDLSDAFCGAIAAAVAILGLDDLDLISISSSAREEVVKEHDKGLDRMYNILSRSALTESNDPLQVSDSIMSNLGML